MRWVWVPTSCQSAAPSSDPASSSTYRPRRLCGGDCAHTSRRCLWVQQNPPSSGPCAAAVVLTGVEGTARSCRGHGRAVAVPAQTTGPGAILWPRSTFCRSLTEHAPRYRAPTAPRPDGDAPVPQGTQTPWSCPSWYWEVQGLGSETDGAAHHGLGAASAAGTHQRAEDEPRGVSTVQLYFHAGGGGSPP